MGLDTKVINVLMQTGDKLLTDGNVVIALNFYREAVYLFPAAAICNIREAQCLVALVSIDFIVPIMSLFLLDFHAAISETSIFDHCNINAVFELFYCRLSVREFMMHDVAVQRHFFREEIFKNINFGSQKFSQHNSSLSNITFTLILKRLFQIRIN